MTACAGVRAPVCAQVCIGVCALTYVCRCTCAGVCTRVRRCVCTHTSPRAGFLMDCPAGHCTVLCVLGSLSHCHGLAGPWPGVCGLRLCAHPLVTRPPASHPEPAGHHAASVSLTGSVCCRPRPCRCPLACLGHLHAPSGEQNLLGCPAPQPLATCGR